MDKSKGLVKKETAAVALTEVEQAGAWGHKEVSSNDMVVPKILPMQGLSKKVAEGLATMGEFRNSLTNELIGKIESSPFEVIPFHCTEVFDVYERQQDGQFKYKTSTPIVKNPSSLGYNDNAAWQDVSDGIEIKRVRKYNFFVLLPQEIAEGIAMPYVISFKSSSVKEGKKLFTLMYVRSRAMNLSPAAFKIKIDGVREKNDKGIFIVPNISQGHRTSVAEVTAAKQWFDLVGKSTVKVDDSDEAEAAAASSSADTGDY